MSLKRKSDQLSKHLHAQGQISAVAAARATRNAEAFVASSDSHSDEELVLDRDAATDDEDPVFRRSQVLPEGDENTSGHELDSSEIADQLARFKSMQLSTWHPSKENVLPGTEKAAWIRLNPGEIVTFVGQYDLWVRKGAVTLYGAVLKQSNTIHRVFAPSTHALPSIVCNSTTPAEIEVWSCHHSMRSLSKISPLYRRIWNHPNKQMAGDTHDAAVQKRSFSYLGAASDDDLKRVLFPLTVHPAWDQTMRTVTKPVFNHPPKVLVCGPKAAGKSTFARLLTNHLITADITRDVHAAETVCWLDLDPGQPEFSPPGLVSLVHVRRPNFGPPFSHPYADHSTAFRPLKAHAIGSTSPKNDPIHFLHCAADLLTVYQDLLHSFPRCPLVINCPGWILGSALEVMTQLIKITAATDIVLMDSTHPNVIHVLTEAAGKTPIHKLPRPTCPPAIAARTAAELRTMQDISYFHQLEPEHSESRWTGAVIDKQKPWTLNFSDTAGDFLGIWSIGEQPSSNFLACVLEGSLVAVCVLDNDAAINEAMIGINRTAVENLPFWPCDQSGLPSKPDPLKSRMIGLALVQEVDARAHTLKLQTPLSDAVRREAMSKTRDGNTKLFLVRGGLDTPGWAYLESHYASHKHATTSTAPKSVGAVGDEDLTMKHGDSPEDHEALADDSDEDLAHTAWVKKMKPGDVVGQRWRVRRDIGRQAQPRLPLRRLNTTGKA